MIDTGISQYRVIQHDNNTVAIHRVYTNDLGEVIDYVREPVTVKDNSVPELTQHLIFILNALVLPVINVNDLTVDKDVASSVQSALDLFKTKE
jgi:hypothetical protein